MVLLGASAARSRLRPTELTNAMRAGLPRFDLKNSKQSTCSFNHSMFNLVGLSSTGVPAACFITKSPNASQRFAAKTFVGISHCSGSDSMASLMNATTASSSTTMRRRAGGFSRTSHVTKGAQKTRLVRFSSWCQTQHNTTLPEVGTSSFPSVASPK